MFARAPGQAFLEGAHREFRRLHQLVDEAVDGPGVDELPLALGALAGLGVALGDLDGADAELLGEGGPFAAGLGHRGVARDVAAQVEQGAFDKVGDHAGIGAVIHYGGGGFGAELLGEGQGLLADDVVGAGVELEHGVVEDVGPGLDGGVDV